MADSDDEDVLYDNHIGRTLIGGRRVKNVNDVLNGTTDKRKLRKTLALCLAFVGLGLCVAVLGPTLLSLKEHFETILPKASLVFTGRSFGYLCGAVLGGMFYDRFNPLFLIGLTLFLCGGGFFLTPFVNSLLFFAIFMSTAGVSMGVLDTGANLLCLRMWGKKGSAPMLQALHFSFAFGAFLAPLLTAPFLADVSSNSTVVTVAPSNLGSRRLLQVDPQVLLMGVRDFHEESPFYREEDTAVRLSEIRQSRVRREDKSNKDKEKPHTTNSKPTTNTMSTTTTTAVSPTTHRSADKSAVSAPAGPTPTESPHVPAPPSPSKSPTTTAPKSKTTAKQEKPDSMDKADPNANTEVSPSATTKSPSTAQKSASTAKISPSTAMKSPSTSKKSPSTAMKSSSKTAKSPSKTTKSPSTTPKSPSTKSTSRTTSGVTLMMSEGFQTQVERFMMPYLIIGVFVLLTSILFFYFLCTTPKGEPRHSGTDHLEDGDDTKKCTFHLRVMSLLFLFYFLYVGAEVSYGGFVATFAVQSSLEFSQDRAALVVSVFWGTFTLGRGLAICLASVVSPLRMIIFDLVGAVAACVALSLAGDSNETVLWTGTSLLGLSMASLFPSGIAWLQTYTRVTGNAASFLVVGSALGEMVVPLLISSLFTWISDKGYMFLMYIMLAITLLCAAIFVYVIHLAADTGQEKESVPARENHAVKIYHDIKTAIPMEDMSINGINGKPSKQMGSTLIPHKLKPKNHKE
ncbi:sodium-dependent glucose transporter 1A-like [Diadema setosum]|uniref:sodium-dependent glucose transporter 1A-like n=1 Tax=Diadema setosum TaxID=31175 RepID=UPI003B3BA8E9